MKQKINKRKTLMMFMLFFSFMISFVSNINLSQIKEVSAFTKGDFKIVNGEITQIGDFTKNSKPDTAFTQMIEKYQTIIVWIGSGATLTLMMFFILNITKVAANATNPMARSQAIMAVVWTGIAVALLGSVTIWFGFFYTALQGGTT